MSLHLLPIPSNMAVWAWRGVVTFAALAALGLGLVLVVALPAVDVDTTPLHSDAPIVREFIVAAPPPELTALDICLDPEAEKVLVVGINPRYEIRLAKDGAPRADGQPTSTKYLVTIAAPGNTLGPSAAIETEGQGVVNPFRSDALTGAYAVQMAQCVAGSRIVQDVHR